MSEEKKMAGTDNRELTADELNEVSGGYTDSMAQYVDLLNRYGHTAEATRLQKSGAFGFSDTLKSILSELGFPENVDYYLNTDRPNHVYMNGRGVGDLDLLSRLEDYFVKGDDYYGMY